MLSVGLRLTNPEGRGECGEFKGRLKMKRFMTIAALAEALALTVAPISTAFAGKNNGGGADGRSGQ